MAVYGGGSFGTAMACVLGRKGIQATLVVRKAEVVEAINTEHRNPCRAGGCQRDYSVLPLGAYAPNVNRAQIGESVVLVDHKVVGVRFFFLVRDWLRPSCLAWRVSGPCADWGRQDAPAGWQLSWQHGNVADFVADF